MNTAQEKCEQKLDEKLRVVFQQSITGHRMNATHGTYREQKCACMEAVQITKTGLNETKMQPDFLLMFLQLLGTNIVVLICCSEVLQI